MRAKYIAAKGFQYTSPAEGETALVEFLYSGRWVRITTPAPDRRVLMFPMALVSFMEAVP